MATALPWIYLGATVLAGGAAAYSQKRSGALQSIAYKQQAKEEEFSSRDREIGRKRQLIQAIASQNVEAGAFGLDPTQGSRRAVLLEDVKRAKFDDLTDRAMTTRRAAILKSNARESIRSGNIGAATTLVSTVGNAADAYPVKPKKK